MPTYSSGLIPSGFHTKTPYAFPFSPIHATFPLYLNLLHFITQHSVTTQVTKRLITPL